MEKTGEDSYDAHLKIGVAGIKGSYVGKIWIDEKTPPESFTLRVEGKGAPGWLKGTARIQISPKGEGSELRCEAEGHIGGGIAAGGPPPLGAGAKKKGHPIFPLPGEKLTYGAQPTQNRY